MPAPRHNEKNPKQKQLQRAPRSEIAHTRWLVLAAGLGLILFALVLKIQPSLLSKDTALAADIFGKVGIVFMCTWLAWPAIEVIWRAPSGVALFISIAFSAGLFVYRPKTLWITGPFLVVATVLAILLGWIRNQRR
jgi:hypothetical protein